MYDLKLPKILFGRVIIKKDWLQIIIHCSIRITRANAWTIATKACFVALFLEVDTVQTYLRDFLKQN